jgi:hypothetical protein
MSYILILLPAPSEKKRRTCRKRRCAQTVGNEPILPRDPENRVCIFERAAFSLCLYFITFARIRQIPP